MVEWIRFAVFTVFGLCIGIIDFRTKKIPNILLLALAGTLLAADIFLNPAAVPYRLLAGLAAYGLFYAVYRFRGGLGYGDVKYAGAIGYFLGPFRVLSGLLCAVLFGLAYWCAGRFLFRWSREQRFPFGPWLSCGAITAELLHWSMA